MGQRHQARCRTIPLVACITLVHLQRRSKVMRPALMCSCSPTTYVRCNSFRGSGRPLRVTVVATEQCTLHGKGWAAQRRLLAAACAGLRQHWKSAEAPLCLSRSQSDTNTLALVVSQHMRKHFLGLVSVTSLPSSHQRLVSLLKLSESFGGKGLKKCFTSGHKRRSHDETFIK